MENFRLESGDPVKPLETPPGTIMQRRPGLAPQHAGLQTGRALQRRKPPVRRAAGTELRSRAEASNEGAGAVQHAAALAGEQRAPVPGPAAALTQHLNVTNGC